jgi:hypothetical protein
MALRLEPHPLRPLIESRKAFGDVQFLGARQTFRTAKIQQRNVLLAQFIGAHFGQ